MEYFNRTFSDYLPLRNPFTRISEIQHIQADLFVVIRKEIEDWYLQSPESVECQKAYNLVQKMYLALQTIEIRVSPLAERGASEFMKVLPSIACTFAPEKIIEKFDELSQLYVKGNLASLELADCEFNDKDYYCFESLGKSSLQAEESFSPEVLENLMMICKPDTQIGDYTFKEIVDWATS